MEIVVIAIASLVISLITFFSGFGLGTILMPVFAIFFPLNMAIALTGVVHLLNNLFKLFLVGKKIDKQVLLRFGIPAIIASFLGAQLLLRLTAFETLYVYSLGDRTFFVTPVKLTIALLLIIFSLFEVIPRFKNLQFSKDKMVIGGILSGFFGGLSGMQGALRSAFLVKSGLSKEAYIATGVAIACLVDLARLPVYLKQYISSGIRENIWLVIVATLAAFAGAFIGSLLLKKITFSYIQILVTIMILLLAIALGMGLI